jgi:PqqD family protein of HPr-rel-A system
VTGTKWWIDDRPERKGEAWVQREGDRTAVFNPETGLLHLLNPSALAIWELCDGQTTASEMADAISEITGLDQETTVGDVQNALQSLQEAKLIRARSDRSVDQEEKSE